MPAWIGGPGGGAAAGLARARALGEAGEEAVSEAIGLLKNTQRIASASRTAAYRIPDFPSPTTLSEVKNVAKLSFTNQLRDFAAYAKDAGLQFDLYVRRTTELAKPLVEAVENGLVNIKFIK